MFEIYMVSVRKLKCIVLVSMYLCYRLPSENQHISFLVHLGIDRQSQELLKSES